MHPIEFRPPHSAAWHCIRIKETLGSSLGALLLLTGRRPASGPCPSPCRRNELFVACAHTRTVLDTAATALHLVLLDFDGKCEINFAISLHERDDTHNWPQGLNDLVGVNGDGGLPLNGARGGTVTAVNIYVLSPTDRPRGRSGATTHFQRVEIAV
jgi:hypothetical protein